MNRPSSPLPTAPLGQAQGLFTANWITRLLVYAMLVAFPFQIAGVPVGTTTVDISNIIFIVLIAWLITFAPGAKSTIGFRVAFSAFLIIQIINFLVIRVPMSRFASGLVWIGGLFLLYGYRSSVRYNVTVAYYCVLTGIFAAAAVCAFDLLVLGIDRPKGIMAEPSPAGMVLLAALAGSLIAVRAMKSKGLILAHLGCGAILLLLAFQLKTMHFFSFAIAMAVMGAILRIIDWRVGILAVPLIFAVYLVITGDAHYANRFDLSAARITNVSLLTWLHGFEQMRASLQRFPFFGAGLGGTGYFYFYSVYGHQLALFRLADLNRFDAFSGLFRLVIELGPIVVALMLMLLYGHFRRFAVASRRGFVALSPDAIPVLFLMTFAFTIIVGTLVKEPTWSHSTVVVSALLFLTLPYAARSGQEIRPGTGRGAPASSERRPLAA